MAAAMPLRVEEPIVKKKSIIQVTDKLFGVFGDVDKIANEGVFYKGKRLKLVEWWNLLTREQKDRVLDAQRKRLQYQVLLRKEEISERDIARIVGVSQQAVNQAKKKILS